MSKTTPSPRPWFAKDMSDYTGAKTFFICFDDYSSIAEVRNGSDDKEYGGDEAVEANATHLIKCVNMHEKLVRALRDVYDLNFTGKGPGLKEIELLLAEAEEKV